MKHIENNFVNVFGSKLYDTEVKILAPLMRRFNDSDLIESVFMIPNTIENASSNRGKLFIRIGAITKNTDNPNELVSISNQAQRIQNFLNYRNYSLHNEFVISFYRSDYFFDDPRNPYEEKMNGKEAVSSYVIIDKEGRLEEMQDRLGDTVKPSEPSVELENIDLLKVKKAKIKSLEKHNVVYINRGNKNEK